MLLFKKKILIIVTLLLIVKSAYCQLEINNSINFISTDSTKRTIENIGIATNKSNAINVLSTINSDFIYETALLSNDTFAIALPFYTDSIVEGTIIKFKSSNENTGPACLKINAINAFPLVNSNGQILHKAEIRIGSLVQVLFYNNEFRIIHNLYEGCPVGFVQVNSKFCIEIDERNADYFGEANQTCHGLNARLCTWGEWYNACQNAGLGLFNMTNNYEWVNSGSDHASNALLIGYLGCTVVSNTSTTLLTPTYQKKYRCCYSK